MDRKLNQLKAGAVLSYVQMGLGIIISLIYTPVMIRLLGKSEYGLYNTVASTISMLSILSLGFNSGYIRYYSKYKNNNETEKIDKLNGLFLTIFLIIGIVALLCGLYLTEHLNIVFDEGLTEREYEIAKVLMLLLTVNLAVGFPASVFSSIISAHEKFVVLKLVGMVKTVLSPLVTLPLLLMGYRSIAMVSVTVFLSLSTDLVFVYYVLRKLNQRFVFRDYEKGLLKSIFIYTGFIAVNIIIDQINMNIDKVLLGRFKGTEAVAVYAVGATLESYYQMLSTSISGVFTPRVHHIINSVHDLSEQRKEITNIFTKVGRIQYLVLALIASGFVFFGKQFVEIWAGPDYTESYYVALVLILPVTIPLIQNVGIEIQRAENKHQFRSIAYAVMAAVNLVLTIFLCQAYGAVGAAIGTGISFVLANGIVMNVYYHKKCNIDIKYFWKNICKISIGLIVPVMIGIIYTKFIGTESIIKLLIGIAIYAAVYAVSMYLIGMNEYEKALVKKVVERFS